MKPKPASASKVSMVQVVLPTHANAAGNMHGGEVMKIMDSAAFVVAQRHALCNVVTLSVDKLIFKEPILIGDLVICDAELIYTGKTSMEIFVSVRIENLTRGEIKPALEAYFVMVALDRNGRPNPVPPLLLENEQQRQRFEAVKQRLAAAKGQK